MFWTPARRAPKMWLNPWESAQPPKTMSMVRARRWQEEENLAIEKVRLLGVLGKVRLFATEIPPVFTHPDLVSEESFQNSSLKLA